MNDASSAVEEKIAGSQEGHRESALEADESQSFARPTDSKIIRVPHEVRNLVSGGLAGMLAKSVVAPIDRIKILFQVTNQPFRLRNIPHVGLNIINHEGVSALWRGNSAMMLRVFPYSGIQFMVFDKCKTFCVKRKRQMIEDQHDNLAGSTSEIGMTSLESLAAGSLAGVVSVFFTYPLDLTRAQLAVYTKKKASSPHGHTNFVTKGSPSFFSALSTTFREKGAVGLYRGITPTVLGILPYAGVAFAINEQSKRKIRTLFQREPTTLEKMLVGGIAGLVAQTLTYPLEVTRRRMQTHGLVCDQSANEILRTGKSSTLHVVTQQTTPPKLATTKLPDLSMMETTKSLYREQGIRGFFKGVTMNWIKGPIAFSISFTTYDIIKGWIESSLTQVQI